METPKHFIDQISTRWPLISDPVQFVMRYAPAIRGYLGALVRDPHDLDDVAQDFLMRVVQEGFVTEERVRGRFRDYLKASVRNAALSHLRRRPSVQASEARLAELAAPDEAGDACWIAEWRRTMLDHALERLEDQERQAPESRLYTVLALTREQPEADSRALAEQAERRTGRPMSPEAFRKQLSRARAALADLLVAEVRRTLEEPSPDRVDAELADLGLLELVKPYREEREC